MVLSTRIRVASVVLSLCTLSARAQTTPTTPTEAPATTAPVPTPPPAVPAATVAIPAAEVLLSPTLVPGNYKTYLTKRYASDKEARAAVEMFARKRTGGTLWLVGGGAFLGYIASQTGTKTNQGGTTTVTVSPLGYLIFGGVPLGIAISKFSRFSNESLFKVLKSYESSHQLPGYVLGRLNPGDYK